MEKVESILDVDISQLEIDEPQIENSYKDKEKDNESENLQRRSTRKKIRPLEVEKRRVLSKPKRLSVGEIDKRVINYYLDKKIKRQPSSLETIFEQPKSDIFMSKRKFSRMIQSVREINFPRNKNKVKKRNFKVKRGSKPKKLSMDLLLAKLATIESDNT